MGKNPPATSGDLGLTPESGDPLEKEMATHSSVLAWGIPGNKGAWWSTGSQRVGQD